MYTYLKGILVNFTPSQVTLEVNGIGYLISIPCSALGRLPQVGEPVQFYTSFVVREFSHALYGFLTFQEKEVFEVLLNVTGIGPKLALSLIGHLPSEKLQVAIMNKDLHLLCKVPGVGKKTAERLLVELTDKLTHLSFSGSESMDVSFSAKNGKVSQRMQDAVLALVNLGYNQATAQKAIRHTMQDLEEDCDLALLLTSALQAIQKF